MTGSAVISDCGRYRYSLTRELQWELEPNLLNARGGTCVFVMLNPSTADADQDDPTIRRCIRYATDWAFDRLHVVNLYAYRATDPRKLEMVDDPIGPRNDNVLRLAFTAADLIVAAWGARAKPERVAEILSWSHPLHCIGVTAAGAPKHPLYIRADAEPRPWPVES